MSPLDDDVVVDRLRAELGARADGASGQWRVPGPQVRQEAARRRTRRATVSAVFVIAGMAAALTAAIALPRDRVDRSSATPAPTATTSVRVPVTLEQIDAARAGVVTLDSTWEPWFAVPLRSGSEAVLFRQARTGTADGVNVVAVQVRDGRMQGGRIEGEYGAPERHVIAVPVPDGDGTSMVVIAPDSEGAVEVLVTSSTPREPSPQVSRAPVVDGAAVVPVPGPMWVTAVGVRGRDGSVVTAIPARSHLGPGVPARLDRVVVSAGPPGGSQLTQVRTDGITACRMTVAGFTSGEYITVPWGPFDAACARIDGSLQPLLAADRFYSSVTGVAPQGTARVRLHWRNGTTSTVPVSAGDVPAFATAFGSDSHRASDLVRLEALDSGGKIIAEVVPPPGDPTQYGS